MEVLVLKKQGLSLREIARKLRIHRKTVKKYLEHPELVGRYVMTNPAGVAALIHRSLDL